MNAAYVIVSGVVVAGFAVGWFTAAPIAADADQHTDAGVAVLVSGGSVAARAGQRMAAINPVPQDDIGLDVPPPPPPPPDIAVLFRRDLTAIEESDRGLVIWIVDNLQPSLRRRIAPGEVYQDGWVVSAIAEQSIELRRRRERREVAVYAPPDYSEPDALRPSE